MMNDDIVLPVDSLSLLRLRLVLVTAEVLHARHSWHWWHLVPSSGSGACSLGGLSSGSSLGSGGPIGITRVRGPRGRTKGAKLLKIKGIGSFAIIGHHHVIERSSGRCGSGSNNNL